MGVKLPRCKVRRCKRIARIEGYCKSHAEKKADAIVSARVRGKLEDGTCEATCYGLTKFWQGPTFACSGALACCHLFSRRYKNVKWDERNLVPMCASHHFWFDHNPIQKDDMLLDHLEEVYMELHDLALEHGDWTVGLVKMLEAE